MGRQVSEMVVEIRTERPVTLLGVQVKVADLQTRLLRYRESVRETPGRQQDRLKVERVAIDGVSACVRRADEMLAKALEFAAELGIEEVEP